MTVTSDTRSIHCNIAGQAAMVPATAVYFAFGSGRLGYDCISCGAQCCRGHGYGLSTGRELLVQLQSRPALSLFLHGSTRPDHAIVRNWPPACFFLNSQGECSIQTDHGYDAKPSTCRLFPFNRFYAIGTSLLVVAPHQGLCPLTFMPADRDARDSDHDFLLAELTNGGIAGGLDVSTPITSNIEWLVDRETHIRDLSTRYLRNKATILEFVDAQNELTFATGTSEHGPDGHASSDLVRDITRLLRLDYAATLLEMHSLRSELLCATPVLRAQLLFTDDLTSRWPVPLESIHRVMLATYIVGATAAAAGHRSITYQAISAIFLEYFPLIVLLSFLDTAMEWRWSSPPDLFLPRNKQHLQSSYTRIVKGLLPHRQRKERRSLVDILSPELPDDPLARIMTLKGLTEQLAGRIAPVGSGGRADVRGRLRQAVARHLSNDVIAAAARTRA